MTALVADNRASTSGCPFSSSSSYSGIGTCPVSKHTTTSSPHLPPPPTQSAPRPKIPIPPPELVYLPPLLSLLPSQTPSLPSSSPPTPFSFSSPTVGFTSSRLPHVDPASVALHHALHAFKPTTSDYAYADYSEAFNWAELRLAEEVEREWYVVAFRSTREEGSVSRDLYEADRAAHEEAVTAGGLLAYWYGVPNERGSNLATCIWMSRKHAVRASSGQKHIDAMSLASAMYANYDLERYVLRKVKGETGVTVERWIEGEVAFAE